MPEVRVGPLLRHVGATDATVWVETDQACRVEVLGHHADTFEVEGHHFALVCVAGLDPSREHPYAVHLDGQKAWPPDDYDFPPPRIRLMPQDGSLRLVFGSCRASAPHHPPYTHRHWWHLKGQGIDVLRAYGLRMRDQPSALWPDALMMLGDQLYADQVNDTIKDLVAEREVHADGPVEVLEDFEEYCIGYWDAWRDPVVRWMLSTLPSSMMLDDHEINDKWNTSQAWLAEKRRTDWYQTRIIGGLMAYWIYQHLGNMSPDELAEDTTFQRVQATRQGADAIHRRGMGLDHREGRRALRAPAVRQLGADPAAVRDARRRGLDRGDGRRGVGTTVHLAGGEAAHRGQPRPLGVLPGQLPRLRGPGGRRRGGQAGAGAAPPTTTKLWQVVCSGLRKDTSAVEAMVLRLGHTRVASAVGRMLRRTVAVDPPRLRWRAVSKPQFRNQIGTLELAGGRMAVRIERATGGWRRPRLTPVIEQRLLLVSAGQAGVRWIGRRVGPRSEL